jgi:rod shape determining protein RodA
MKNFTFFGFDILLLGSTMLLMTIGVFFIYSSGISSGGEFSTNEYLKQLIWVVSGIGILVFMLFINYAMFKDVSPYIYGFFILVLLFVLVFGKVKNGARSWIGLPDVGVQPSEFMKIATILFFATYLTGIGSKIEKIRYFLLGLAIILVPMGLILLQPDLGTSLVYIPIFIAMTLIAGARLRHIAFVCGCMLLMILFVILPFIEKFVFKQEYPFWSFLSDLNVMWIFYLFLLAILAISIWGWFSFKNKAFYWIMYSVAFILFALFFANLAAQAIKMHVVKEYQIKRIITFLNPEIDRLGSGWNIIQSITAIGSGGIFGKGFLMGTQSHYQYLPQQSTDFIYSIVAEELGFVGGGLVIGLFAIILIRGIKIASNSYDRYGMLVGAGIIGMIFFHVVINIGMAMGIMPITGIPLFFLSYGGSSLWTGLIGVGILMNISLRRYKYQ